MASQALLRENRKSDNKMLPEWAWDLRLLDQIFSSLNYMKIRGFHSLDKSYISVQYWQFQEKIKFPPVGIELTTPTITRLEV